MTIGTGQGDRLVH